MFFRCTILFRVAFTAAYLRSTWLRGVRALVLLYPRVLAGNNKTADPLTYYRARYGSRTNGHRKKRQRKYKDGIRSSLCHARHAASVREESCPVPLVPSSTIFPPLSLVPDRSVILALPFLPFSTPFYPRLWNRYAVGSTMEQLDSTICYRS